MAVEKTFPDSALIGNNGPQPAKSPGFPGNPIDFRAAYCLRYRRPAYKFV
jgi:hypothetical protein